MGQVNAVGPTSIKGSFQFFSSTHSIADWLLLIISIKKLLLGRTVYA